MTERTTGTGDRRAPIGELPLRHELVAPKERVAIPLDRETEGPIAVLGPIDFLFVALAAFLSRLVLILAVGDATILSDMVEYHERAEILLRDNAFNFDAWRGPGYPVLLALVYALPGRDLFDARIAGAVIGALTAVMTSILASLFVKRRPAIAAGLIVALYPGLVLSSSYILTEGLYGCLALAALVLASERSLLLRSTATGAVIGLATLTRSVGMGLIPAIVAADLLKAYRERRWGRRLLSSVILGIAFLVVIAPWLAHTGRVAGGYLLDSSSAYSMLVGHNPRSTGRYEIPDVPWMLRSYYDPAAGEMGNYRRAIRFSIQWIRDNPLQWARLVRIKIGYLWGLEGREHAWIYANSYFGPRQVWVVWTWALLLLVSFPILAIAAVCGLCRSGLFSHVAGMQILLVLGVTTALHVASFGESRFHLPLVPLLAVLAVRGVSAPETFTRRRFVWCAALIAVLAAGWITQAPTLVRQLINLSAPDAWRSAAEY